LSAVAENALTPCPLSHARRESAAPKARAGEGVNPKNDIGGEQSSPPISFFSAEIDQTRLCSQLGEKTYPFEPTPAPRRLGLK